MKAARSLASAAVGLALLAGGCSGARSYVIADQSRYPISLSDGLRGSDGALIPHARKQPVGTFELTYSTWSMLWTAIPLANRTRNISDEVNAQVAKAGGDAVIGLDVSVSQCGWNYATLLGLLPGCNNVKISGDIVKVAAR